MSAVEKNFPDEVQAQNGEAKSSETAAKTDGLKDRPTLIAPPPRPVRPTPPKTPKPTTAHATTSLGGLGYGNSR
ncbi:MAG: hypothetical protein HC929_02675 [Leptolyngbyaceae cyanobacterium SM2_5_2]|nr:hypothetical protein [Leptolyngbyaceae cyanobacterium SM2_5_2]